MKFSTPLLTGTLIKRYRRCLADVRLDNGSTVTAHVFSMGSMRGCCEPGRPVLLSDSGDRTRRHRFTWELINIDGNWIGVNPTVARKVLTEAITGNAIESLRGYEIQSAATYGKRRRMDIILQSMEDNCFINIHTTSWAEDGTAFYPDAPSETARKSLLELTEAVNRGHRAIVFFLALREDCHQLRPARTIDVHYLHAVQTALQAGVEMMTYRAGISPREITLGTTIPFVAD